MKNTCIFDLNESIHAYQFSKKIFIQKKLEILEIKKKLFTIKREIISNINDLHPFYRICYFPYLLISYFYILYVF